MNKKDCVVIGYGPCGISTAIYLKRYGFEPLVIGKDYGALAKAEKIENFYGVPSIEGKRLVEQGIAQAKALGIEVITDEILSIEQTEVFEVIGRNGSYFGDTIMLALGVSRNTLAIAAPLEGKGISYCAICDGFFYKKKNTAIIGNGAYMKKELSILKRIIPNLTVFTNGEPLTVEVDVPVICEKILSFNGTEHLESITTTKDTYQVEGCFIAMGSASGFTLAKHLGIALKGNSILVDENKMTNVKGIFAGGDCIGGLLQVSKAISDGAIAGTAIAKYLKGV